MIPIATNFLRLMIVVKCKINFLHINIPRKLLAILITISISKLAFKASLKIIPHGVLITFLRKFIAVSDVYKDYSTRCTDSIS